MYIYEREGWPRFLWDQGFIANLLLQLRHQQGRFMGGMESMGFHLREETVLQALTQDVVKSSAIEGEILDESQARSSVARHLGMEVAALDRIDRNVEGMVVMTLDAIQKFDQPLTRERLFFWHKSLFLAGKTKIRVGGWRRGAVQVVSGPMGLETVHFEAPAAHQVDGEMGQFIHWINHDTKIDLVLKAALAHLWFVTIHPFEDGNGRIGRAIVDLLLARSENSPNRCYSLSAQIQKERKGYYAILEKTQKGTLDVTHWLEWFFSCLGRAIAGAASILDKVVQKTQFWDAHVKMPFNERQRKIINRLLDGFEGKLTSSKWAKMAKCSQDTAYRDILDLIERGVLSQNEGGGRSTSYSLVL